LRSTRPTPFPSSFARTGLFSWTQSPPYPPKSSQMRYPEPTLGAVPSLSGAACSGRGQSPRRCTFSSASHLSPRLPAPEGRCARASLRGIHARLGIHARTAHPELFRDAPAEYRVFRTRHPEPQSRWRSSEGAAICELSRATAFSHHGRYIQILPATPALISEARR
jgi:hypothetical protein